jgi:lysophospholipase L1-like esterase
MLFFSENPEKRWIMRGIRFLMIGSLFVSLVFIVGFLWAYQDQHMVHDAVAASTAPAQKVAEKNSLKVVALGDSLTRGYGDSSGKGYVGDVVDQLRSHTKSVVSVSNLAINGQTSRQLLKQIGQQEVVRQIAGADVILLTIGGNDLNQQGRKQNELTPAHIQKIYMPYKNNLVQILQQIREVNKHAVLYYVGLYDPYFDGQSANVTAQIVRQWNNQTAETIAGFPQMIFVPTFDLFQLNEKQYLYLDHFHPNTKGYQRIAERITPLLIP